jgi:predicted DNA-binding transcriptional regulator AlpA
MQPDAPKVEDALPALIDTHQAARLLGIGERTLWRWSRSGVCPGPIFVGCGVRPSVKFSRDELLAWVEAGCPRNGRAKT